MPTLAQIVDDLQRREDCRFSPANGFPVLPGVLQLPPDLIEFYSRFSEACLFGDPSDPRYHIQSPKDFVPIGYAIMGQPTSNLVQQSWFALAHVQDGNYIAIDCYPDRIGLCYDAFHETIDMLDYCKVIATSFTELLDRAAQAGDEAWWLTDRFATYGYADELCK